MHLKRSIPAALIPLYQPARYKGIYGGRGGGKSHDRAEALIERHAAYKTDSVCVREVQRTLKQSVKRLLESKIQKLELGHLFEIQDALIKDKNGGVIIFEGMQNHNAESIKSLEGFDIAWFEEAQTCSQRSLDLLRPTIRKPDSELWFTWNPNLPTDPIDVLLRGTNPPPGSIVVECNYFDNPWFPQVLRDEMKYDKARDPDKYAHVWKGQYEKNSEARVFKNWCVEEFEVDTDAVIRQGADWGFSVDPTVLVQCYIKGRTLFVPYEVYRVGCEIVDTPDLFFTIPDSEKWPIISDSARPETISHMRNNGFPKIMAAIKGAKSLEEGVEYLKSYDIVVHPRCEYLIAELENYKYKVDPLTQAVLPVLADKDNHVIDALRYALEGVRRVKKEAPIEEFNQDAIYYEEGWMR